MQSNPNIVDRPGSDAGHSPPRITGAVPLEVESCHATF